MTEQRVVLVLYDGTRAHNPFNMIKGLERFAAIGDFNSKMAGNPKEVIKLQNMIIGRERDKKRQIETFTNQLYAYFLERKKQEEYKN